MKPSVADMAAQLMHAQDHATTLPPLSASDPSLDVPAAYRVLAEIENRRRAQGWRAVGRKIGFTNRTIWPLYGVYQPMWAHVWSHSVRFAPEASASLSLSGYVQPRIEPEVAFRLRAPVADTDDALEILQSVDCMAPSFEIVQSHFPDWKFTAADCTADCALHGALVIGPEIPITDANRASIADTLPTFGVTLRRGDDVIDEGIGAHVLGSPALALGHLAQVLRVQRDAPPLAAGEWISTGTLTDAWPVQAGETWRSDYGALGLRAMTLTLT